MSIVIFPSKSQAEDISLPFNFLDQLAFGEVVTGATVTVVVYSGIDSNPDDIIGGAPVVTSPNVSILIVDGVVGVIYTVVCTVVGSDDHVYSQEGRLAVITPGGLFSNH